MGIYALCRGREGQLPGYKETSEWLSGENDVGAAWFLDSSRVGTDPVTSGRGCAKGACRTWWWAAVRLVTPLPSLSCNTGERQSVICSLQGPCQNLTCFPPDIKCFGTCDQGLVPVPLLWNQSIVQQPVSFPDLVPLYNKFSRDFIADCARRGLPFLLYYASHVGEREGCSRPKGGEGNLCPVGRAGKCLGSCRPRAVLSSQYLPLDDLGSLFPRPGLVAGPF